MSIKHDRISTVDDAIEYACATLGLVYKTIGDYRYPSDGFCKMCPATGPPPNDWRFQNNGATLRYVRTAVVEKLKRDGFVIDGRFDPETGDPLE